MTRTGPWAASQLGTELHRALSDPSRGRILEVLQEAEAPLDARGLGTRVGLHLNTVRSHLRVLAEAGLVSARREERTRPGRPRVLYEAAAE
ncbi:MAG: helix-turn-helix domain-containing protein, partial [Gemmatimonadota bacterium]